jgi:hypothetical protein
MPVQTARIRDPLVATTIWNARWAAHSLLPRISVRGTKPAARDTLKVAIHVRHDFDRVCQLFHRKATQCCNPLHLVLELNLDRTVSKSSRSGSGCFIVITVRAPRSPARATVCDDDLFRWFGRPI